MTKNTVILSTLGLSLLILGCGESNDEIRKKDKVIILKEVNEIGCTALELYSTNLKADQHVKNIQFSSKNSNQTCATYGKTKGEIVSIKKIDSNTDIECSEVPFSYLQSEIPEKDLSSFEDAKKSCVLTFDVI